MYGVSALLGVPAMIGLIIRWGAVGAVAGTALIGLILLVLIGAKAARFVGYSPFAACREAIVTPLLPVAPLLLLLVALDRATAWDSLVRVAAGVLVIAGYPFVTALTAFAPGERAVVTGQATAWRVAAGALVNRQLRRVAR